MADQIDNVESIAYLLPLITCSIERVVSVCIGEEKSYEKTCFSLRNLISHKSLASKFVGNLGIAKTKEKLCSCSGLDFIHMLPAWVELVLLVFNSTKFESKVKLHRRQSQATWSHNIYLYRRHERNQHKLKEKCCSDQESKFTQNWPLTSHHPVSGCNVSLSKSQKPNNEELKRI